MECLAPQHPPIAAILGETGWAVRSASPLLGLMSQVISCQYPVHPDAWANDHRQLGVFA
ncbi:hypothetical protein ANO14919_106090 [Xylariales sp. No.14919]|nr:hypothetical protein ANO14919_106090 [Xylariales sp. No.14919]